ncbi:MAG: ATP-binding protein, partial [Ignavibacteria bacterium]|nr:ATP-binding protein [Ignavibacteria bacterium]
MLKKVAITGPESTGKSWLAEKLAAHFNCNWVPEYAREYLIQLNKPYQLSDVEVIARVQMQKIETASIQEKQLLIVDTEMLVCSIWTEYVFGEIPESINKLTQNQQFNLYLLC